MKNNTGTYQCLACQTFWDTTRLLGDAVNKTCGDAFCAGSVKKVSDKPKEEYVSETRK